MNPDFVPPLHVGRLTPARRLELQEFRRWNTSLDEAMAEIEGLEDDLATERTRVRQALDCLAQRRHYVGHEAEFSDYLEGILHGDVPYK